MRWDSRAPNLLARARIGLYGSAIWAFLCNAVDALIYVRHKCNESVLLVMEMNVTVLIRIDSDGVGVKKPVSCGIKTRQS